MENNKLFQENIKFQDIYDITIFDLETTGLSYKYDDIIEICFMDYKTGESLDSLVHTEKEIPHRVTCINGIDNEKIKYSPKLSNVLDKISRANINNTVLVGHNCHNFDSIFLLREAKDLFKSTYFLDTVDLAEIVLPGLKKVANSNRVYSMTALSTLFGIKIKNQHSANGDTTALKEIFTKLINLYDGDITNIENIPFIKRGNILLRNK